MKEYRKSPRHICNLNARFETEKGHEYGTVRNLSAGGFYLATEIIMKSGRQFQVEIALNDKKALLNVLCEVVWGHVIETEDIPEWIFNSKILEGVSACQLFSGMGVKFLELSQEQIICLEKYLCLFEKQV